MVENNLLIGQGRDEMYGEYELYLEIVHFMNIAFPDWNEKSNLFKTSFIDFLIEENGFLFTNSNLLLVIKLKILHGSIVSAYDTFVQNFKLK